MSIVSRSAKNKDIYMVYPSWKVTVNEIKRYEQWREQADGVRGGTVLQMWPILVGCGVFLWKRDERIEHNYPDMNTRERS